jgi:hypothetical protein
MKYLLKTETNDTGNLVFSKERQGRIFIYLAKDENGNVSPVSKDWIIQHKDEVLNVRVNGENITAIALCQKKKIDDFGQKIGGAKKDLWKSRGLGLSDLVSLTVGEREMLITKDNVWLKPDAEKMVNEDGYDRKVVYYIVSLRNALNGKPKIPSYCNKNEVNECQNLYVDLVGKLRDRILRIKSLRDVDAFDIKCLEGVGLIQQTNSGYRISSNGEIVINNKFLKLVQWKSGMLDRDAGANSFMLSDKGSRKEINSDPDKKKQYYAPELEHIKRTGLQHKQRDTVGQDFLDAFKIRGGEFGNWVNEVERQENMNFAFESFCDLADILGIPYSEVGLKGHLGIAFGARGSGRALAHYEPMYEVINLTKMKGAGSLAHEYFHAIDDLVGKELGGSGFISKNADMYPPMRHLLDVMTKKKASVSDKNAEVQKNLENVERVCSRSIKNIVLPTGENKAATEDIIRKYIDLAKRNAYMGGIVFLDYVPRGSRMVYVVADEMNELFVFIEKTTNRKLSEQKKQSLAKQIENVRVEYLNSGKELSVEKYIKTDFKENADSLDARYAKSGHGYWNSEVEMCARAFACYIKDKLAEKGVRNDYLCGHAESVKDIQGDKVVYGYPRGQERVEINKAFDEFFNALKIGYFSK